MPVPKCSVYYYKYLIGVGADVKNGAQRRTRTMRSFSMGDDGVQLKILSLHPAGVKSIACARMGRWALTVSFPQH